MFFDGWMPISRVVVLSVCTYIGLIELLRVSGKRTLSKMNAFDLVVTVALGSTLATAILSRDTALAQSLAAFAMLVLLQYVVAFLSVHSRRFSRLIKAEPRLLYYRGEFLAEAMRRERVTREEVLETVRGQGIGSMEDVDAVVLETAATVSVIRKSSASTGKRPDTLVDVRGTPGAADDERPPA